MSKEKEFRFPTVLVPVLKISVFTSHCLCKELSHSDACLLHVEAC